MKKCHEIQQILLGSEGEYPEDVKKHLEECEECRILAEEWNVLKTVRPPEKEIPRELDAIIRANADSFCQNRYIKRQAIKHWFTAASIAAAAMVLCWAGLSTLNTASTGDTDLPDNGSSTIALTTSAQPVELSWSDVNMENECFELDTEIELNYSSITGSNSEEESDYDEIFKVELPDLLT
jgi:hypothetical protein